MKPDAPSGAIRKKQKYLLQFLIKFSPDKTMKANYEDRPSATRQQKTQYGNLYLHIAFGIYLGGIALLTTSIIISTIIAIAIEQQQTKIFKNWLESLQESVKTTQVKPIEKPIQKAEITHEYTFITGDGKFKCNGYRNRINYLTENMRNGILVNNYSEFSSMKSEIKSLKITIKNACEE